MHHAKFLIIKLTRCTDFSDVFLEWNSTCFRQFLCHIIRSFSLYTQQWYVTYRFADSCQETCMSYTIAVCTMKNSWWWTEELSETCGVSFQEYIWEINASRWFYYKKLEGQVVTMEHFFKCLNYFLFNFFFEGELSLLVWFQFSEDKIKFYMGW